MPDPSHAEIFWGAYAWPAEQGPGGLGTFFMNQEGYVMEVEESGQKSYGGLHKAPAFDAAYDNKKPNSMKAHLAIGSMGRVGNDGFRWSPVGS